MIHVILLSFILFTKLRNFSFRLTGLLPLWRSPVRVSFHELSKPAAAPVGAGLGLVRFGRCLVLVGDVARFSVFRP